MGRRDRARRERLEAERLVRSAKADAAIAAMGSPVDRWVRQVVTAVHRDGRTVRLWKLLPNGSRLDTNLMD